jgi:hypothetical protein
MGGSFDGERAFADLRRLVAFRPRPSGSEALARTREWSRIFLELGCSFGALMRGQIGLSPHIGGIQRERESPTIRR